MQKRKHPRKLASNCLEEEEKETLAILQNWNVVVKIVGKNRETRKQKKKKKGFTSRIVERKEQRELYWRE